MIASKIRSNTGNMHIDGYIYHHQLSNIYTISNSILIFNLSISMYMYMYIYIFSEKEARDVAYTILKAIKYLHDRNIIHRSNIS